MYAKTRPTAGSLTQKQKRLFAVIGVVIILLLGGLGVWGALAHDAYGTSANGCVNVTLPSSTGGSTLHYCGSQAKAFCQSAFTGTDQVSLRARPQCVLAGLKP
jgi:xanthine/uracil/vitamin C permease (AzgA family)